MLLRSLGVVFGLFRKRDKKQPAEAKDPLAAFDGVIAAFERQAAEVRKSAATLLALRGELTRDLERYRRRVADTRDRAVKAAERADHKAHATLERDVAEAQRLLEQTEGALARVEGDAQLLAGAAEELRAKVTELKEERQSARARLKAGLVVSDAMKAQVQQFDRVLALDAARDEVERAHALAELYREESDKAR